MNTALVRLAIVRALAFAAAPAALVIGCSSANGTVDHPGEPPSDGTTGIVALQLTLPGGEGIDTVAYTVTGPQTYSGTADVSTGGASFAFVIPGVAPGDGYTITLTAISRDGAVACSGTSSSFSVRANQTTSVAVSLACTTTGEAGAVVVEGTAFDCASWRTAVASPNVAMAGGAVSLAASAIAPDPAAITYQWSASAGTIADATSPNATFTCPATPGEVTITLAVADGPIPQGGSCPAASSQTTLTVTCAAPCTKVVTSSLVASNPFGASIAIDYAMVGGGGGGGYGPTTTYGGFAGATASGSFVLGAGSSMTAYVGGGGGAGVLADMGGGGGAGWYGGGGGGIGPCLTFCPPVESGAAGGGGSSAVLVDGQAIAFAAGGAGGSSWHNGGGGGGGTNQGGAAGCSGDGCGTSGSLLTGGTGGGSGGYAGGALGGGGGPNGLDSITWSSETTVPAEAGAGGIAGGGLSNGGNAGLVILRYASPTGACSL